MNDINFGSLFGCGIAVGIVIGLVGLIGVVLIAHHVQVVVR